MESENNYTETDLGNVSPNPRGEYDSEAAYEYLDLVNYQGGSYICTAELGKTITGTAPSAGKDTEYWQLLTLPGDLTPEYIAMHDNVVQKAKQVESSRAAVELSQQEIEAAEVNVKQMQQDTQSAAQDAQNSKESASGYAQSAEASRLAAEEAEQNATAQVQGFDDHVAAKVEETDQAIAEARSNAVDVVDAQGDKTAKALKTIEEGVKTAVQDAQGHATNASKSATSAANAASSASSAANVATTAKNDAAAAKTAAEEAAQSATQSKQDVETLKTEIDKSENVQQIQKNKEDISSLKEDIDEIAVDEKGKNFLYLKNGKESKDTYFDVIFADGLITISKGVNDWNNYLNLTTSRKIVLDEGTYTFSIQNVSDDVNMGFIRLRNGNTQIADLSLYASSKGVISETFILNDALELTLEIEVNCAKLSDTPKSFNLQIEKGEEKTDYVPYSVQKMVNSSKIFYDEISKNRLCVKDMTSTVDGYCILSVNNQIVKIQKAGNSFPSNSYINRRLSTMYLKKGTYSLSVQKISYPSEKQLVSISFKVNNVEIQDSSLLVNIPSFMKRTITLDNDADIDVFITFIGNDLNTFFESNNNLTFAIMVEENEYPSTWIPYESEIVFDKNIYLPKYIKNDLYGLTWNAMGDSLTQAIGSAINYQGFISGKYKIKPNNYGIGGSTIANGSDGSNPMVERYVDMVDADIITVWGGTNDYGAQKPIGTNDSTDESTFKGALNVMVEGLINKYPSKRIGFITPMRRADYIKSIPLEMYVNAMIEICAKWCIPCLDLYHNGNLNPSIDVIANTYFRVVNNVSDKLHLNEKGQLVISRIIEDFLHRL